MKTTPTHLLFAGFLMACAGGVCLAADQRVSPAIADVFTPLPAASVRLSGHVGEEMDAAVRGRYASEFARKEVYPETIEALRRRIDDKIPGGRVGYWQGEFWGKWVLGAVAAANYSGDPKLREFIRQACREAIATQDPSGYIGTYSKTDSTTAWNIWGMKYTLWALVEAYELFGDAEILAAARRQMDYLMTFVGPGKTEIVKTGEEFGFPSSSILQPLLFLYRDTGDKRYLDFAQYIVASWSAHPDQPPAVLPKGLAGQAIHDWFPNPERWAKAYELIHCVEGLAELHRATGNKDYLRAAENIAADLIRNERTIHGNISQGDRVNHAPRNPEAHSEVCDAVYYQRLCFQLLRITGKVAYAHELERTFYNSHCAAMNADATWTAGHLSLKAQHVTSPKHCLTEHQHCCAANAPRGLLEAAGFAVMTDKQGAVFNLYLPGDFSLALPDGEKLKLDVKTDYPMTGSIRIEVNPATPRSFPISLRIPDWSARTAVKVNGTALNGIQANSYFQISREWKAGDRIELELDMRGRVSKFPDSARAFVAIERGPIVLARDSLLKDDAVNAAVSPAADKDGFIPLEPAPAPEGFWMAFRVPLADGRTILMCDYPSVGEIYKQQIANLYTSPTRPGMRDLPPVAGVVPEGMEDFRVWLPLKSND